MRLNTRMKFNRKGRKVERKGRGEFEIENESELELEVEIQKINDIPLRPLRRILASLRLITRMKFNFKGRKVERKGRGEFEIENEV
ncbi:MAG: hypothetical protein ABIW77_09585 [Gelidibacter sp.]|uniref:hypothetical protein n=2 Tax=Gelidibacter sp. TaxID=2018083 RepID=UPI00326460CD